MRISLKKRVAMNYSGTGGAFVSLRALDALLHTNEDMLQTEFIARFYGLITQSIQPPYAISIDGLWGAGKTTTMRALQEKLGKAGYPVFWYNPWKYRQTQSVVLAFLQSLYLTAADKKFLDDMNKNGATILRMLLESGMDAGLRIITKETFSLKGLMSSFTAVEDTRSFSFNNYQDTIKTIEKEFVELILTISRHHEHKPVIVFVDNLDRCLPTDVIHFLEALKNLFITSGCKAIFICGIDTQIAKQFISEHYRRLEEAFALNYFRKVFNLTLSMPYSCKIKGILLQYIKSLYEWDDPKQHKAESLAKMVYTRGLQMQIYSVRKYLDIVTNFYTFMKFNPNYEFQFGNDFVTNLLVIKEAWKPLYENLVNEALKEHSNMEQLIQGLLDQEALSTEQEKFLTAYIGKNTAFAKEHLSTWLAKHPTLAHE